MGSQWKIFVGTVAIVIVLGLGTIFAIGNFKKDDNTIATGDNGYVAGATTEGVDYSVKLAKHLSGQGMVMYGSFQSIDSIKQKELFGSGAQYIDYVECDAAGEFANPDECSALSIETYPTWVYGGIQYRGITALSELAKLTNFSE